MKNNTITVKLYGKTVGYLANNKQDRVFFEYENTFKETLLEISPIKIPLASTNIYTNNENAFFQGLPGVFHDSLPDKFGNKIIKEYYQKKGINEYELSVIQKLAYIGKNGMGALEYIPEDNSSHIKEALEIKALVDDARKIIQGKTQEAIPYIMESGGSA